MCRYKSNTYQHQNNISKRKDIFGPLRLARTRSAKSRPRHTRLIRCRFENQEKICMHARYECNMTSPHIVSTPKRSSTHLRPKTTALPSNATTLLLALRTMGDSLLLNPSKRLKRFPAGERVFLCSRYSFRQERLSIS